MKDIKLVIWDLDETFWRGTLSEGDVSPIEENISLVRELTNRGIMNSIVSKNDYEKAARVLKKWDIYDCFIFPQISWQPKGEVIKDLLNTIKLRAENVLFLDDNPSNLEEAKFYNPSIETSLPISAESILNNPAFKGKDDKKHSRLKQYKILEQRTNAEKSFSSNEDFLRASNIRIAIDDFGGGASHEKKNRIYELIQRTNQLNYTKVRSSEQELDRLLNDASIEKGCISAQDNFGEYGVIGFYALKDHKLLHFLFSCRTLGFGIENFLWEYLDYPQIGVQGEVAVPLSKEMHVDWIRIIKSPVGKRINNQRSSKSKILMASGCDLEGAVNFLEGSFEIDKEFATVVDGNNIKTSDTSSLVNTLILKESQKNELCANLPHFVKEITFGSKIFNDGYDVIVLSLVDDYFRGIYKHKREGYYIGYCSYFEQDKDRDRYPLDTWKWLDENFKFIGKEPLDVFRNNIEMILQHISSNTKVILINGIDLDVSDWIGEDRVLRNREMNEVVDEIAEKYSNVSLLDMRKIVTSRGMLTRQDNRHFNRQVYYRMAMELTALSDRMHVNKSLIFKEWIKSLKKIIKGIFKK